jgi:hypothetical protein
MGGVHPFGFFVALVIIFCEPEPVAFANTMYKYVAPSSNLLAATQLQFFYFLFNEMFFVSFFLKFARAGLGSEPGIL